MSSMRLRKYGVQATIEFELHEVDGVDLRTNWTPAQSDCEIEKNEGGYTICDNTASGTTTYKIVLTATEMEFARGSLKIVDSATKAFLDIVIQIETYGHASALHPVFPSNVIQISDDAVAADNLELGYDGTGLSGDKFPVRQDQMAAISGGLGVQVSASAVTISADGGTETDAYTDTATHNGTLHIITDSGSGVGIEYYYTFNTGAFDNIPTNFHMHGWFEEGGAAFNNSCVIQVYNWSAAAWETIETLTHATAEEDHMMPLLVSHVSDGDVGAAGDVRIRFKITTQEAGSTVSIDHASLTYASFVSAADVSAQIAVDMQSDPTDYHVNVMEVNGTGQTANNMSGDIDTLITGVNVASENNIDFGAAKKTSLNAATPNLAAITGDKASYKATGFATSAKLLAYVRLMTRSDAAVETDAATELTAINANEGAGGGDFSSQTDAEEALRDAAAGNLTSILGTALTEGGAGRLAAALIKFLDVATPAKDINDIGAPAAGGGSPLVIGAGDVGDFKKGGVVHFFWNTIDRSGAAVAPSTAGTLRVYKEDGAGEITAPTGITDSRAFDGVTGLQECKIVLSASTFYAKHKNYSVILVGAVVDTKTVNIKVGSFSIENRWANVHWDYGG